MKDLIKDMLKLTKSMMHPKHITITDLLKKFYTFIKRIEKGECFIVAENRNGKPIFVLMNPRIYELLNSPFPAELKNNAPSH